MEAEMRLKGPLTKLERTELERAREGKVRVNEGDAWYALNLSISVALRYATTKTWTGS